jgi:hypothetical protein
MSSLKRISFIAFTCSAFFTKSLIYDTVNEEKDHKRKLELRHVCNSQPNFLVRWILLFPLTINPVISKEVEL